METAGSAGSSFSAVNIRQYRNPGPSSVITNTTAETVFDVFPTILANTLKVGTVIDFHFYGIYNTALVAPSLIGRARFGGLTGAVLLTTGTLITVVGSLNDQGFYATGRFIVRSLGVTGTMECQGFTSLATALSAGLAVHLENTNVVTVNTTIDNDLVGTIQMGTASPSNTFQVRILTVDIWDP